MPINFDNLPQDRPKNFEILEDGIYLITIKSAKTDKSDKSGEYLSVTYNVEHNGKSITVWDTFYDSEKELPRYKLAQFIRALKIPLTGNFELKDLPKIIVNKQCKAAIKIEKRDNYPDRNVINAFDDGIFYPADDSDVPFGGGETSTETPAGGSNY